MNFINTLAFVSTSDGQSLVDRRRIKMVNRLRDQIAIITQQAPIHRTQRNRVIDPVTNEVTVVEKSVPVKPWWKTTPDDQIILTIKHGMRKVEFQKGKSGILVSSMDELPSVLQGLIDATMAGELDQVMDPQDQDQAGSQDAIATATPLGSSKRSLPAKKGR
jgi:hypothetical protein